jgi:uncharacterized protein DUF6584
VAKADVLARVKQDLALGHTHSATQRLRTLVAIQPDDLELRDRLATVYRQTGNLVEAGRWGFLTGNLSQAELVAFERANPDPWLRLRMLRWEGEESSLPDAAARTRVRELVAAAEQAGPPSSYGGPLGPIRRPGRFTDNATIPCLFVLIVLGVLGVFAAIGVIRIIAWVAAG